MRKQRLAGAKSLAVQNVSLGSASRASSPRSNLPPHLLRMQATLGNQAVQRSLRYPASLSKAMGLDEIYGDLSAYLDQKAFQIKYYAWMNDPKRLESSFRDLFDLYDQLLGLLFGEDRPWLEEFLWNRFNVEEPEPRITDPANQNKTESPPPPSKSNNLKVSNGLPDLLSKIVETVEEIAEKVTTSLKEAKDEAIQMVKDFVTSLAEKAFQVFEDLTRFSSHYPIVITAANKVVHEFKKVEEEKLTQKLLIESGDYESRVLNTKNLTWIDLVRIWFWEMGPKNLKALDFGPDALTTQDVKNLVGVRRIVDQVAARVIVANYDPYTRQVAYGTAEFFPSVRNRNKAFNFLGTYNVTVTPEKPNKNNVILDILVWNDASLQSFSRFRKPAKLGEPNQSIIEKNRERVDPGVELGSTLATCWRWKENVSLSLTSPEYFKALPDNTRTKYPQEVPKSWR